MLASQAPLAVRLHWPLTGPATSWLQASCFSSEEQCCSHRKATAPSSRGAPGGDKHFVEQPAWALCACGTTMVEVGGGEGLLFTELVCMAKEMLQPWHLASHRWQFPALSWLSFPCLRGSVPDFVKWGRQLPSLPLPSSAGQRLQAGRAFFLAWIYPVLVWWPGDW